MLFLFSISCVSLNDNLSVSKKDALLHNVFKVNIMHMHLNVNTDF